MGLATVAPQILKWITGSQQAEEVAEKVIDVALAVSGRDDPIQALAAIKGDPALALEFRKAILQHEAEMDRMYLQDRQNAREREVKMVQAGHISNRANWMIASVITGLLTCLGTLVMFKGQMPGEVVGIVSTISGGLLKCLSDAFQYEFGSSRGSAQKSEMLDRIVKGSGTAP